MQLVETAYRPVSPSAASATPPLTTRRRLPPGWPLAAILCLYPLWWALGVGEFAFVIFSVPMARELMRRRPLRLPPGFGLWLLYLMWTVLSLVMLPLTPPNTIAGSVTGRGLSVVLSLVQLAGVTITLLYVGNLTEEEVPQRRIIHWLSILFLVTLGGGILGLVVPHLEFTSPMELILPHAITSNSYASTLVHPTTAQVQNVLGTQTTGRPAAPWSYTNFWANVISLLLIWFCVYMWQPARRGRRVALVVILTVTTVPVVYSLNRGLWFGLVLSGGYLVVRAARRGDARATVAALIAIPVIVLAFLASPLHTVVTERAEHGQSNEIRRFLDEAAVDGALRSPILGWGGPRKAVGSANSISVGPSAACPSCGQAGIGSTGELWAIMFNTGLVGLGLYASFFISVWWRLRRDRTMIGAAARLTIGLTLFYTFFYNNLPVALTLAMISIALSLRQLAGNPPRAGIVS
jgi:hypothetical protein